MAVPQNSVGFVPCWANPQTRSPYVIPRRSRGNLLGSGTDSHSVPGDCHGPNGPRNFHGYAHHDERKLHRSTQLVILSERSESKNLRIYETLVLKSVRRSFDFGLRPSLRMTDLRCGGPFITRTAENLSTELQTSVEKSSFSDSKFQLTVNLSTIPVFL